MEEDGRRNVLRKQVTEAKKKKKKKPWGSGERGRQGKPSWGRGWGKALHWVRRLEIIYLQVSGEDSNKIVIRFQVYLFRVMVSTDWSVPGLGDVSQHSWS